MEKPGMSITKILLIVLTLISFGSKAEICAENDSGLGADKFIVAFSPFKPSTSNIPETRKHLGPGEVYCAPSDAGTPLYISTYFKPILSARGSEEGGQKLIYVSSHPFSVNKDSTLGFSVMRTTSQNGSAIVPLVRSGYASDPADKKVIMVKTIIYRK